MSDGDPFGVEPGSAPAPGDGGGGDAPAIEHVGVEPVDAGVVSVEQVEHLLSAVWGLCRFTLARGVPDAFQPTEAELREQARPTAAVLSRSARAAAVAQHGDAIGMVMQVGGYAAGELVHVREYRAAMAEQGEPVPTGFSVTPVTSEPIRPVHPDFEAVE